VIVRPASADDVAAVHALERDLFGADAWSEASVRAELTGPRRTAVVACDGRELVGYAVAAEVGDAVDLQRVAVRPEHRRRGLAHALLTAALDGAPRVLLEVAAGNTGALALYAAEGFTEIARRRRYYRDGSDAVVLKRELGARPRPRRGRALGRGPRARR
jgi:ribosomal-protein-alanine acetyltransferase